MLGKGKCHVEHGVTIVDLLACAPSPSAGRTTHLLAVVSDGGQDGAEGLETHGDVQQMGGKEEVVEVAKNGHDGVPDQIQEVLWQQIKMV